MKRTINNDIYIMYEEEYLKNLKLENEQNKLKLENVNLKYEPEYKTYIFEKKIKSETEKMLPP